MGGPLKAETGRLEEGGMRSPGAQDLGLQGGESGAADHRNHPRMSEN
jgi:hypothetical protein